MNNPKIDKLISELADIAEAENVQNDSEPCGAIHRFVISHGCPDSKTLIVVFLLAIELADRDARRQGFKDQTDRALSKVNFKRKGKT